MQFWPDPQVFTPARRLTGRRWSPRARQTAFLVPGLSLTIEDRRDDTDLRTETLRYRGGIGEFVDHLSQGDPVTAVIRLTGQGHFHETVPVLDKKGHLTSKEVERTLDVDVAMRWSSDYETRVQSFVSIIATPRAAPTSQASTGRW